MVTIELWKTYKNTNGEDVKIVSYGNNQVLGTIYYSLDFIRYFPDGKSCSGKQPDLVLSVQEPVTILRSNFQSLIHHALIGYPINQNSAFAQGWKDIAKALEEGKQITIKD